MTDKQLLSKTGQDSHIEEGSWRAGVGPCSTGFIHAHHTSELSMSLLRHHRLIFLRGEFLMVLIPKQFWEWRIYIYSNWPSNIKNLKKLSVKNVTLLQVIYWQNFFKLKIYLRKCHQKIGYTHFDSKALIVVTVYSLISLLE